MFTSQIERLVDDPEGMRLFQQERLILATTERICEEMEKQGINRKQLAESLRTSKSSVTQMLDGSRNMTLRTLSDVFLCLGYAVNIHAGSIAASVKPPVELSVNVDDAAWSDEQLAWSPEPWAPEAVEAVENVKPVLIGVDEREDVAA